MAPIFVLLVDSQVFGVSSKRHNGYCSKQDSVEDPT